MKKGKKKFLITSAIVLALAGGVGGYVYSRPADKGPSGPVVEVNKGRMRETAAASGKIQPHVQVEVKSRASGQVTEILVSEGDVVKAGQLLVKLDPTDAQRTLTSAKVARDKAKADLQSARAGVSAAVVQKNNSQGSADVASKSAELGLGTQDAARTAGNDVKVQQANISVKSAQVASAEAQLKAAELSVEDAETRLKETMIYAPMDGTVLDIPVEKGTIVSSALTNVSGGTSVMTIADLSDLRIIGAIDEAQISRVKPGQAVEIRVDAYPDRVFEGKVERVSPLGKEASSVVTFDTEIVVTDKDKALLRSGMSSDVEIITQEQEGVLLVPLVAVQTAGRQRFVVLSSGEKRPIKTGASDGTRLVVTEGLAEGETILATAPATAKPTGQGQNQPPPGGMMMGGGGNTRRSGGGR